MRAWNLVQCGYFVCVLCPAAVFGALELELEVPGFVVSAPPSPPPNPGPSTDTWSDGSNKRTMGGRLRTYVEEFIPEGIAASLAPSPPAQEVPEETQVADDGEGCVDKIGIASNATSPLYQCAYDRRKCYTYDVSREGYCADFVNYAVLMSPAEQISIDSDAVRALAIHDWVGSSPQCYDAWKKYACAYNYDKCGPRGEMDVSASSPSCMMLCEGVGRHCDVGQLLKTTKRFLGNTRYIRLARALLCSNYAQTGCKYRFENGIVDAELWPGNGQNFDVDAIDEDIDYEDLKEL